MNTEPLDLYYEETGKGIPFMLVHGFPLNHTIWEHVTHILRESYRVILPDLRGHGWSPVVESASMVDMAADLVRILDRLKIDKAVLVGHSMGGYACLAFARRYPQRLCGLGLVSSQSAADTPERRQGRYDTAEKVSLEGVKVVAESMSQNLSNRPEDAEVLKSLIMTNSTQGVMAALKGMAEREDSTDILTQFDLPSLVVAGLADRLIPLERMQSMAKLLPRAEFVGLPGVGHMPMWEAPQATAEALARLAMQVK